MSDVENQIKPELLSVCSLNPFHQHGSASRNYMFANHLGQMLVLNGSDEKMIQTGLEREYGKYTFSIEMPVDGQIIDIIERYGVPQSINGPTIDSAELIVIYEEINTKEVGMFKLPKYSSNHQYFGFRYKEQKGMDELRVGAYISKGTIFLDSPSKTEDGGYKYGVNANIAYMTMPAASEDGIIIRKGFLEKLAFKTYETRVVEWGSNQFALNLYGDELYYKSFPDIGDVIRDDGVLMALRSNEPDELAIVEKGIDDTMNIDYTFDTTYYANGAGGKIVDIKIDHNVNGHNYAERHKNEQPQQYDQYKRMYCQKIVDLYYKLKKQRGEALQLTPHFSRLILECLSVISESTKKIKKLYRQVPLDTFRIEFTIEYEITPGIGFKLTDTQGGKGVLCKIVEDHEAVRDVDGNVADVVMDPNSTISRMNLGRFYEQYINAASRDVHKRICNNLGLSPHTNYITALDSISILDKSIIDSNYNYLVSYYNTVSPRMGEWFNGNIPQAKEEYLAEIVNKGVYLYIPTDNPKDSQSVILDLEANFPQTYGPVTYIGNSGNLVTTEENVRIGSVYMILLEKTAETWSAVASSKLQHFGVISQLTRNDKYSKPARYKAVRGAGEAEVRILISYVGPEHVVEVMDRNNNPTTHKLIVNNILAANKPSNINNLVDRKKHPYGGNKPIQLVNHILQVSGMKYSYTPHKPTRIPK